LPVALLAPKSAATRLGSIFSLTATASLVVFYTKAATGTNTERGFLNSLESPKTPANHQGGHRYHMRLRTLLRHRSDTTSTATRLLTGDTLQQAESLSVLSLGLNYRAARKKPYRLPTAAINTETMSGDLRHSTNRAHYTGFPSRLIASFLSRARNAPMQSTLPDSKPQHGRVVVLHSTNPISAH
jgi:hypothetical protein